MNESTRDRLWQRVEAHLDARSDPFADGELARELAAEPKLEAAVHRLDARLAALAPPARSHAPRTLRVAASIAATLMVSVGAWSAAALLFEQGRSHTPSARVSALYTYEVAVERPRPAEPRLERIVRHPSRVIAWTLEGNE